MLVILLSACLTCLHQLLFSKETRRREPFRGDFSAVPAQIVLLAGEQRLTAPAIAASVREANQTVRNWLKCWMAKGIEGLKDRPMPGPPPKISEE